MYYIHCLGGFVWSSCPLEGFLRISSIGLWYFQSDLILQFSNVRCTCLGLLMTAAQLTIVPIFCWFGGLTKVVAIFFGVAMRGLQLSWNPHPNYSAGFLLSRGQACHDFLGAPVVLLLFIGWLQLLNPLYKELHYCKQFLYDEGTRVLSRFDGHDAPSNPASDSSYFKTKTHVMGNPSVGPSHCTPSSLLPQSLQLL